MTDTSNNPQKIYPAATSEVAKMFGWASGLVSPNAAIPAAPVSAAQNGDSGKDAHPNFAETIAASGKDHAVHPAAPSAIIHPIHPAGMHLNQDPAGPNPMFSNMTKALKAITPYVVVFSAALFVYFYFFSGTGVSINLSGLTNAFQASAKTSSPQENSLAQLEKQNMSGYNSWISQFYYDVSDPAVLDPNADNSGNGLSNFQKYLLNLNPKSYDTLGLGMADSQSLNQGVNPLTGDKLTDAQQAIVGKYFDMEVVMNRLALSQLQKSGQVAGAQIATVPAAGYHSFGLAAANPPSETLNQTAPAATGTQGPTVLGSDVNVDTGKPGQLDVPSLKISAPLVWSSSPSTFDQDLQNGVIHYPGTALPGQIGTAYISGHSSNYVWAKGNYNHVFTHLGDIKDDASFTVTVKTQDGHTDVLHYVVVGRQQYSPTDQAQFKNSSQSVVALSTCWPVGSTAKRLVIFGQLTQVEVK